MLPEQRNRSFRLNLKVDADNPHLLAGLDRWLELGLIDDLQVRELCRNQLTCRLPEVVTQPTEVALEIPVEPEILFVPPRRQPSVVGTIWTGFKDELSVRWLLFLGVFLVILSSGVLAATQWQRFPAAGQYGVLWVYTIAFWGVGAWARGQSGLSLTANTLQIVALLLIPVNFWAIDSFQLWHNPVEWLTALFAIISLSGLAYLDARKRSPEVGLSRMAIAYLGLSYLQLGWQLPNWATISVYLGAIGGVGLWQRRRQLFGDKTWQWASLAIYSLTILLLRALFIEHLPVHNFGLAIAIIGWLVAQWGLQQWVKIDRIATLRERIDRISRQSSKTTRVKHLTTQRITATELAGKYHTVAGILLSIGWLLATHQWANTSSLGSAWQPLAVDALVLIWLGQRLQLRQKSKDLVWMFIVGLHTYGASFAIAPDFIPFAKWDFWGQLLATFGENAAWAGTLVAMPYLFLWIGISNWLHRRQQAKLANTAEILVFGFGLCLTLLSSLNHLGLLLNLVLSSLALTYITYRQPSVRTSLIYVTHLYELVTIAVGIDYLFPSLLANESISVKWGTLAAIFAIGELLISALPVVSGSTRERIYRSAWHYGLGLAAISYGAYLVAGVSRIDWILLTLESFAPFSPWALAWLLIPLTLTWLASRRIPGLTIAADQPVPWQFDRQATAAQCSVGSLILAQGLTFGYPDWRIWGLGFATGLMFFNVRRLRNFAVVAIQLGFGLSVIVSLLFRWRFDSTWLLVGSIGCLVLWVAAARLRRRSGDLAQLYAEASDNWASGLGAVGIAVGTLNYIGNYLLWAWSNQPQVQFHYPDLAISSAILAIGIWYRHRPLAKPVPLWGLNWTLQLGIAEVVHRLGGNTLTLAIVNMAIAFMLLFINSPAVSWRGKAETSEISLLPWCYGLLAIVLRLQYFTAESGSISIAAGILSILVARRLQLSLFAYLGLTAITLGCYELLAFQVLKTPPAGGNIADAFTLYGVITTMLAIGYRCSIWWWEKRGNAQWLSLSISAATTVAHIHWLGASSQLIIAALVPQLPIPKFTALHLGISILLGLYAIIEGRKRLNGSDWWVYVGLVELLGTGIYARSIFTSLGGFDEFLSVTACIIAMAILVAPWASWGWQNRPWHRVAIVLPMLRVLFVPAQISLLNLLVIAGFYAGVAKRQNQFGWIYISLIFADWAAFRILDNYQLRDPLWFATILGMSLLISVQFDPFFRSDNQRENRHLARLIGSGSIAIIAVITHQNLPLIPAGISLLLVLIGIALSIRAFLYMGTITLMLTVSYQLIVLATEYPFTKWIVGLAAGMLIIAIAGNFERRREQIYTTVKNWLDQLQEWQ